MGGEGSPTVCGLDRKLESRSILCSDADGNITEVGAALGEMRGNMTEGGNTTSSTPCSPEKVPELTQECGASSKENEREKATEDTSSEVECSPMWFANQWSSCSSKCKGVTGIHTRKVMCGVMKVIPPPASNTSSQTNDGTETEASGDQDVAEGSSERK